ELGLLLARGCAVAARHGGARSRDGHRSGGGDPPLVLDLLLQLDEVENAHLPELVEHLVDSSCCHYSSFADSGAEASASAVVSSFSLSASAPELSSSVAP